MKRKIPTRNPRATYARSALASRRVGVGARCERCDEDRPETFNSKSQSRVCANCERKARGQKQFDDHHCFGHANSPLTMSVPVNDHLSDLSVAQYDWPPGTLQNSSKSPLLAHAAFIRGFADINAYLIREFLLRNAELLELLDTETEKKWGKKWWKLRKLKSFEPKT